MKTLVFLGDSITDSDRIFSPDGLGYGYVKMTANGLADRGQLWKVINKGVDGFTAARLLETAEHNCISYHPDLVTVLVGINDLGLMMNTGRTPGQQEQMLLRFEQVYGKLLELLSSRTEARILLMEPFLFPWPQEYVLWLPFLERISQSIRRLSEKYHTVFLSLHREFLTLAKELGYPAVTGDGIHLTETGHRYLSERLLEKIQESE